MKFKSPLIIVTDIEKSKKFYKDVLGLKVIMDFGANVTLTGGVALQTKESWKDFILKKDNEITFSGISLLYNQDKNRTKNAWKNCNFTGM